MISSSVLFVSRSCLYVRSRRWSGSTMVLCKLHVLIWLIVEQGPAALAVGAGGVVWIFYLLSLSPTLGDRQT